MFLGKYERSLDDKSRVVLPPELRSALAQGAVLSRSFDDCLCIYPVAKWESLARAIDDLPEVRYEARILARSLFAGATACDLDRHGRIAIPAFLREHANLQDDVVIVGLCSRIEIWGKEAWQAEHREIERDAPEFAEAFAAAYA
jgi:MraZ protein